MANNKVVFGATTIIDISDTTATANTILSGSGCYGADGEWIDGAVDVKRYYYGTSDPVASQLNDGDIYLKVVE